MSINEKTTFEEALSQLEATVKALESGECSLDDSIKLYEKGMNLSKFCYEKINKAKLVIENLNSIEEHSGDE